MQTNEQKDQSWLRSRIDQFQNGLTRYSNSIIRSWEAAREIVQDVFFKLWRDRNEIEELRLKVWLFKVCRNSSIDYLRKEGRMSQLLSEDQEALECPDELPGEVIEKKQMHDCILDKMKELPEHHQEVIRLKFQEELSYKEISDITGHTVNHVGVLLHQAMTNLRKSLAKTGGQNA